MSKNTKTSNYEEWSMDKHWCVSTHQYFSNTTYQVGVRGGACDTHHQGKYSEIPNISNI